MLRGGGVGEWVGDGEVGDVTEEKAFYFARGVGVNVILRCLQSHILCFY